MANKFVPLSDLKSSMPWIRMSAKQRELVQKYIETGYDKVATVKALYRCSNYASTQSTVSRQFSNTNVRALLALHFGESALDTVQNELQRALSCPKLSEKRIQAIKLLAQSAGLDFDSLMPAAKVSAKSDAGESSTAGKTPDVTAERVNTVRLESQQSLMANNIDNDWVRAKIEALSEQDGRSFKHYCAKFNPFALPKGIQKWYSEIDATTKISWLFLRFEAMRSPMFLGSGHVPLRRLNQDELYRAVHAVVSDDTILDVHQIQVLGFQLNENMVRQVQDALTQSARLRELFPEIITKFDEVVR
jgi:hypothetical protein